MDRIRRANITSTGDFKGRVLLLGVIQYTCRYYWRALSVGVAQAFFEGLFKVSTYFLACPLDIGWYGGIAIFSISYVKLKSLNSPELNWFLLMDTKVSNTPNLTNSSCWNFIVISVVGFYASVYFGLLWETVDCNVVAISFKRASEVNVNSWPW